MSTLSNITRIDYPKTRKGWRVRIVRGKDERVGYFWDNGLNSNAKVFDTDWALNRAISWRDQLLKELPNPLPKYRGGRKASNANNS